MDGQTFANAANEIGQVAQFCKMMVVENPIVGTTMIGTFCYMSYIMVRDFTKPFRNGQYRLDDPKPRWIEPKG